jgi:hypothetical protein
MQPDNRDTDRLRDTIQATHSLWLETRGPQPGFTLCVNEGVIPMSPFMNGLTQPVIPYHNLHFP